MDLLESADKNWSGLRRDLLIYLAAPELDGRESWVIEDPLNGKMYRFDAAEGAFFHILCKHKTITDAYRELILTTSFRPAVGEAIEFVNMLTQSHLTNKADIASSDDDDSPGFLQKLLHGYIYFRIPLARPDAFLTHTYPFVKWLWSPWMRLLYFLLGILGLLLSVQQIDLISSSINHMMTPMGFVSFAVTLIILKLGHELAHGYTAKSHNHYIRTMGVAFILFWPVLYSDTTDAWKAKTNQVRFSISAAGVVFELVIAGLSLFFWAILQDGLVREIAFYLATTSIISSIFVNLNPFMRFDGYYLLMDWWHIDNLQPRAFELLKYRIRRLLFDWKGEQPEQHSQASKMVVYAILTSFYRVFIAVMIALAVYNFFSREIGLLLMLAEIWVFLLQPVFKEVIFVWKGRRLIGSKWHVVFSMLLISGLLSSLFIPFSTTENLPAVVQYKDSVKIYSPFQGKLTEMNIALDKSVNYGDKLIQLTSDKLIKEYQDIEYQQQQNAAKIAGLASEGEEGGYRKWLAAESKRIAAEKDKKQKSIDLMSIEANYSGLIKDINEEITQGSYVAKDSYLFEYSPYEKLVVKAYLLESQVQLLQKMIHQGEKLSVSLKLWNIHAPDLKGEVVRMEEFPSRLEDLPFLYDVAGGPVASVVHSEKRIAADRYFMLDIQLAEQPDFRFHQSSPAWAEMYFPAQSLASKAVNWMAQIFYAS